MRDSTQKLCAARDEVTRALNANPLLPGQQITLAYLREAMVLAFVAGADWDYSARCVPKKEGFP
jgi:hypothetical protein